MYILHTNLLDKDLCCYAFAEKLTISRSY